ncbi:unnamed protein product [Echinostoma caproni]|uniref:Heparan-sulfate 6-O-sulfotransferase n=1 Tax=Echinostoma caproni TaxID=27848 RepID=A0A183ADX6_9TREM|nr:unnamed protein product [Echinostoma caproni]
MDRYLSEWLHVRRGGTWHFSRLRCAGHSYSPTNRSPETETQTIPNGTVYHPCYMLPEFRSPRPGTSTGRTRSVRRYGDHPDWAHVPLTTFLACPYNLAHNRQTRMLADLPRLGCYRNLVNWSIPTEGSNPNLTQIQHDLSVSAKHSLLTRICAFGFSEHLVYTQYMLQRSLHVVFQQLLIGTPSVPLPTDRQTHAALIRATLNTDELKAVEDRIQLDTELYRFARALFTRRLTLHLVSDSFVPFSLRRPLRTLLFHRPTALWAGLEHLLLGNLSQPLTPFAFRLQKILIRSFIRQGSTALTESNTKSNRNKWVNKLASDFAHAGLLTAFSGSSQENKVTHVKENLDEKEREEVYEDKGSLTFDSPYFPSQRVTGEQNEHSIEYPIP